MFVQVESFDFVVGFRPQAKGGLEQGEGHHGDREADGVRGGNDDGMLEVEQQGGKKQRQEVGSSEGCRSPGHNVGLGSLSRGPSRSGVPAVVGTPAVTEVLLLSPSARG